MELARTSVLVTGAGGGIGQALTARLLAEGADVIAVGRDQAALHRLDARPVRGDSVVVAVEADVNTVAGRATIARATASARRPVRCVVHNAGTCRFGLFESASADSIALQVQTNLLSPLLLTRALLPQLLREPEALVVGIGSTFGSIGYPGYATYAATKFGLRGFLESLGREHAGSGLRTLYASPRATRTPMNPAAVDALNRELGVATDDPDDVARQIVHAMRTRRRRVQIGWPERLFTRVNGALPAVVDGAIARQLPAIRRHALAADIHPNPGATS